MTVGTMHHRSHPVLNDATDVADEADLFASDADIERASRSL